MTRRKLSEDELSLWKSVAKTTNPLGMQARDLAVDRPKADQTNRAEKQEKPPLAPFQMTSKIAPRTVISTAPSIADELASQPVSMDFKTFKQMRRGKLRPEAKIDLHGLTAANAHGALAQFILSSHAQNRRLVLVITGKGRVRETDGPIPERIGVLRRQVPVWLGQAPLSTCVQQVTTANRRHGGDGAYYVYLRRR